MDDGSVFGNRQCDGYSEKGDSYTLSRTVCRGGNPDTALEYDGRRRRSGKGRDTASGMDNGRYGRAFAGGSRKDYETGGRIWRRMGGSGTGNLAGLSSAGGNLFSGTFGVLRVRFLAVFRQEKERKVQNSLSAFFAGGVSDLADVCGKGEDWMRLKGSYTLEAALLMTIILPLLAGILYLGFYLHDQAAIQNAAYELAVLGSLAGGEKDMQARMERRKQEICQETYLGIRGVKARVQMGKKKICVEIQGTFQTPGLVLRFFGEKQIRVRGASELAVINPANTIIRLNRIRKGIEGNGNESDILP